MGAITNSKLQAFADRTGIHPATGEHDQMLQAISRYAWEIIKIVELERSGIRDGDGFWHGCDPLDNCADELFRLVRPL